MSAEALGSLGSAAPETAPALARSASPAALEPSLVNRLLGVAGAVFAIPVLVELRALALGGAAPTDAALGGALIAAALLALGFGALLRSAPRAPALRPGRVLWGVLGAETAALSAALLLRLL